MGLLQSPEDISRVVVTERRGVPVLVRDVATINTGYQQRQGIVGMDDKDDIVNGIILPQNDSKWTTTVNHALCYLVVTNQFQTLYDEWFKGPKAKAGFELPMSPKIRTVIENQCPFGAETWLDRKT